MNVIRAACFFTYARCFSLVHTMFVALVLGLFAGKHSANPSGHGGWFLVDTGHVNVYFPDSGPTIHVATAA